MIKDSWGKSESEGRNSGREQCLRGGLYLSKEGEVGEHIEGTFSE